jgi:hypothetical protein
MLARKKMPKVAKLVCGKVHSWSLGNGDGSE